MVRSSGLLPSSEHNLQPEEGERADEHHLGNYFEAVLAHSWKQHLQAQGHPAAVLVMLGLMLGVPQGVHDANQVST